MTRMGIEVLTPKEAKKIFSPSVLETHPYVINMLGYNNGAYVTSSMTDAISEWLHEQPFVVYTIYDRYYAFAHEDDMFAFTMRWRGAPIPY